MTHRFYQAWQQQDCSLANATKANPTGCLNDLFAFVMGTYLAPDATTSAGNEMGFYNAEQEQASFLKTLADRFTLSDNFHQSFLGGTGANHFMLGTGDAGFWSDGNGNPVTPPSNIANPNPRAEHGQPVHGRQQLQRLLRLHRSRGSGRSSATSSACPTRPSRTARQNHYYMLNNTNPGYPAGRHAGCRRCRARCRRRRCRRSATP